MRTKEKENGSETRTRTRSYAIAGIVAIAFALIAAMIVMPAAAQLADTPWPMYCHDLKHTGLSPYTGPETNATKWIYTVGAHIRSSPAIGADGTIYVGVAAYDNRFCAIYPNGTLKWSYLAGLYGFVSSPAIGSDGTIYVGGSDSNLHAIYPDGTLKWSYLVGDKIYSSPAIGSDGTIYVGSQDKKLYAINPDGTLKWSYLTGDKVYYSSPAIDAAGTIYVGSFDDKLHAINPDGTLKWSYLTGGDVRCSPTIGADGTIYVGSKDDNLYAINPDGTLKWSYLTGNDVYSSPAIGADGTIYVGSNDYKLYALYPDGTLKWSYLTGDKVYWSSPTIDAAGTIYIGSRDDKLHAINPDGTLKWSYLTGGNLEWSSPAIGADGTIYVGSRDHKLYAFGPGPTPEYPDLVITNKSEALEDGTFTVTYTVANVGDGDAGASNTTLFIDGVPVMEDPVPVLAAGASHTATVGPFDCPCGATTLNITVCADNENVVEECNEENNCLSNELECQHPLWEEINAELDSLKGNVSAATMPSIIQRRLVDKLEYAKALKENAKIECKAGNFDGATKKLGVAKSQVESFASMVKITRRISPVDKASFLADSTEIKGKIQALIEYIETKHKC